jgi:hypothetical protein
MVPWKGSLGRFDVPGMSLPEPYRWEWRKAYEALVLEAGR